MTDADTNATLDDGYRLTYGGLDYLAMHTHQKNKSIYSVGSRVGVGKESDIVLVADSTGSQRILKIHRLGRISFRSVKTNRDYLRHRVSASWMYMSRLAAVKEFAFMKVLHEHDFPVPLPIAQNRHTIVMSLIDAFPLRQISYVPDPAWLYSELIGIILRLAQYGLIHGDFNEFNILVEEKPVTSSATGTTKGKGKEKSTKSAEQEEDDDAEEIELIPILIDFPQMVSMDHPNAEMYFDRDVQCVKTYFRRKFGFTSDEPGPFFKEAKKLVGRDGAARLDVQVEASGFSRKMAKELEAYMKEVGVDGDAREDGDEDEDEDEDDESGSDQEDDDEDGILNDERSGDKETIPEIGELRISQPP